MLYRLSTLLFTILLLIASHSHAQENILPRPNSVEAPAQRTWVNVKAISARIDPTLKDKLGNEGYTLTVSNEGVVTLRAAADAGLFYARQTLAQLAPEPGAQNKPQRVPAGISIVDKPRFVWRAFMLDEARHFFGVAAVKQILDQMAQLKMNVFHWHLTDDTGWRIEIKKYPKLTSVGAYRSDTEAETWNSGKLQGKPHSGFYTQRQIRDIVAYAAARHIIIVPEIDIPGHSSAACAAYPELKLTRKQPAGVPILFGGTNNTALDPSNERVYSFYGDIFTEIATLFPAKIIHIGGDEVRYDQQWKDDAKLAAFMQKHGMKSFPDLQLYFTNRIADMLKKRGMRVMGWTEVLGMDIHGDGGGATATGNADRDIIVHHWDWQAKTDELVKNAARAGQHVINAKLQWTYLNQSIEKTPLKKTYQFEPLFKGLEPRYHANVLGLGVQLWTEWIPDTALLHHMLFPRLLALAEVGWTEPTKKDWPDFLRRLKTWHAPRMTAQKIAFDPAAIPEN